MKTPFYELAEKIGNEEINHNFIDVAFSFLHAEHLITFCDGSLHFESDSHCQTALLFADLLWQEEMKGGKK